MPFKLLTYSFKQLCSALVQQLNIEFALVQYLNKYSTQGVAFIRGWCLLVFWLSGAVFIRGQRLFEEITLLKCKFMVRGEAISGFGEG